MSLSSPRSQTLTLPSNASFREFPDNTNGNYKIRLEEPLSMNEGEWEAALMDAHYSNTWFNVDEGELTVEDETLTPFEYDKKIAIPKGRYNTVASVVDALRRHVSKNQRFSKKILVVYNINTNLVHVGTHPPTIKVSLSRDLREILGMPDRVVFGLPTESVRPPDVLRGMTALYVYVSFVAPRPVGDTRAPLLRTVPISGEPHANIHVPFATPQYVPVSYTSGRVVEVTIARDDGRTVDFKGGKTILNVNLRRVRQ